MSTFNMSNPADQKVKIEGQKQIAQIRQEISKAKTALFEQKGFIEKCIEQEKDKLLTFVSNHIGKIQEEDIKMRRQKEELRKEITMFRSLVKEIKEKEVVGYKLFENLKKINDEMLTNLKRSHEEMQGISPDTQLGSQDQAHVPAPVPLVKKSAPVMVTPA